MVTGEDVIRWVQSAWQASCRSGLAVAGSGDLAAAEVTVPVAAGLSVPELPTTSGWLFCVPVDDPPTDVRVLAMDLGQPRPPPTSGRAVLVVVLRGALDAVTERLNAPPVDALAVASGECLRDETMVRLALLLRADLASNGGGTSIFGELLLDAFAVHLVRAHARLLPGGRGMRGTLASWQLRRAQDLLRANLDRPVRLRDVADACRLSVSHFSRAFRRSTGRAPATWLREQRVEAAKALLRAPTKPLSEVAAACGFADQSHFTRVFQRQVGSSPGEWRRVVVKAWQ